MDKIEQIKTYLQNQKKEWRLCQSSEAKYRMEAIDEFLEVINSLPEEPVNEDLEKELKEDWLFADKIEVDCLESMCLTEGMFVSLAKKYFELGLKAREE